MRRRLRSPSLLLRRSHTPPRAADNAVAAVVAAVAAVAAEVVTRVKRRARPPHRDLAAVDTPAPAASLAAARTRTAHCAPAAAAAPTLPPSQSVLTDNKRTETLSRRTVTYWRGPARARTRRWQYGPGAPPMTLATGADRLAALPAAAADDDAAAAAAADTVCAVATALERAARQPPPVTESRHHTQRSRRRPVIIQ